MCQVFFFNYSCTYEGYIIITYSIGKKIKKKLGAKCEISCVKFTIGRSILNYNLKEKAGTSNIFSLIVLFVGTRSNLKKKVETRNRTLGFPKTTLLKIYLCKDRGLPRW